MGVPPRVLPATCEVALVKSQDSKGQKGNSEELGGTHERRVNSTGVWGLIYDALDVGVPSASSQAWRVAAVPSYLPSEGITTVSALEP